MQGEGFQGDLAKKGKLMYSFPRIVKSWHGTHNLEARRDFAWEKASNPNYGDFGPDGVNPHACEVELFCCLLLSSGDIFGGLRSRRGL